MKPKSRRPTPIKNAALQIELNKNNRRLSAEQRHLSRSEWIQPYVDTWLPAKAYPTLVVILMVISLGYILKNIFLIFDSILVDRLAELGHARFAEEILSPHAADGFEQLRRSAG